MPQPMFLKFEDVLIHNINNGWKYESPIILINVNSVSDIKLAYDPLDATRPTCIRYSIGSLCEAVYVREGVREIEAAIASCNNKEIHQ